MWRNVQVERPRDKPSGGQGRREDVRLGVTVCCGDASVGFGVACAPVLLSLLLLLSWLLLLLLCCVWLLPVSELLLPPTVSVSAKEGEQE